MNRASPLVSACPYYVSRHLRTLSITSSSSAALAGESVIQIIKSVEDEVFLCAFYVFFFLLLFSLSFLLLYFLLFLFFFSPSYSSVPAVHLTATAYSTFIRTRECVCVREARGVTAALTHRLFCRQDVSLVSCACEGQCVAVLTPFISDLLPHILL